MRLGPRERAALATVIVAVVTTAIWRAILVAAGPDPDSDAYGHHVIARLLVDDPTDHAAHWVWLPLFHWLQVPLAALGGSMQLVRYLNVGLWALLPLVLYGYLRSLRETPAATAALAAILAALCPIGMQMGTTAQPEPLFALVVLAFAWTFERERHLSAALLATAAVLLRYEAWAVVAAAAAFLAHRDVRRRRLRLAPYLSVALPAAAVLGWALLRWPIDGRFFGFVFDTQKFADEALASSSGDRGPLGVLRDALYYPYDVAYRVYGPVIVLAPLGAWRLGRRHPLLALSGGACLGFITLVWLMRGSLGLDRHFVSVIPLYATAMALGVEIAAESAGKWLAPRWPFLILSAGALVWVSLGLSIWMGHWRGAIVGGYRDRLEVAAFLRSLPDDPLIFCDEATVEVLSGLDRTRFVRRSIDRPAVRARILEQASAQTTFVASWLGKLEPLREHGTIVFRPAGAPAGEGLAVLRIEPPAP